MAQREAEHGGRTLRSVRPGHRPALLLVPDCVTLSKSLMPFEPQFLHQQNGGDTTDPKESVRFGWEVRQAHSRTEPGTASCSMNGSCLLAFWAHVLLLQAE